jgi:hypothetical protein
LGESRVRLALCIVGVVFVLTAAEASGADDENWLLATRPGVGERTSFLRGLLTWPKDEAEKEQGDGEKKDEGSNDEEKEEPLESDRPDFTECSSTVGYQRLQIEGGYTYTHAIAGDPTHDAHDLPELLLRYGVAERLELRLAWDEGMVFDRYTDHNSGPENGTSLI